MNLVLRDPFFGDLDALFPGFFRGPRRTAGPTPELPRLTSYTDEAGYVLEAEVPGLAPADVDVTVDDGVITLKASASGEESDDDGRITRRFASGFERSFRVPADVDAEAIEASLSNGVLALRLPKVAASSPRQIPVG
ncbi:MAG: Hsp20/alpha crystallin family protein [Proteobacteria bacterium]|nr:Hsp20/alpha crystallin family protein [Pseudomonadota bacterium]